MVQARICHRPNYLAASFHVFAKPDSGFNPNNGTVNYCLESPYSWIRIFIPGEQKKGIFFGRKNIFPILLFTIHFKENIYLHKINE